MQVKGVTADQFRWAVRFASTERYGGNVMVKDITDHHAVRRPRITASVMCKVSTAGNEPAIGARRSWSGRRGPWACWHAFRDVLNVLFETVPDAHIVSGHSFRVTYNGIDGFRANYPGTAHENIGSYADPAYMPDMCMCSDSIRYDELHAPASYLIALPL